MKFFNIAPLALMSTALLGNAPQQVSALSCGISGITKSCLGDSDVRYDADVGYGLKDQDAMWENIAGLYIFTDKRYDADGTPSAARVFTGLPGTWDWSEYNTYVNITVSGSRFYYHVFNMIKNNVPGLPGMVLPYDVYYTSTFEKDGSAKLLAQIVNYSEEYEPAKNQTLLNPVAGKALFGVDEYVYQTLYCNDPKCSTIHGYIETYETNTEGENVVSAYTRNFAKKVELKEWMEGVAQTYIDINIPPPEAPIIDAPLFIQPFDASTATTHPEFPTGYVFTEDDWKTGGDPELGVSPYVEPDGVLTGGFIAGVTIGSIIVAVSIFYFLYKRGVAAREERVKQAVAKSIAKNMNFTTHKALTPAELQNMFDKIDVNHDGALSKEEIKGLVEEAGVATMSDNDIDILFSSIDFDGNGALDFTEFAAFFAAIASKEEDEFVDDKNSA